MCLNIDYTVGKDGNFDGVPMVGMSFADCNNMMNSGNASGVSNKKTAFTPG